MQDYDYSKLKGRMKEKGFTQESIAEIAGISACSMNLTLNNNRNFKQGEILKMRIALDIPAESISDYFFTQIL